MLNATSFSVTFNWIYLSYPQISCSNSILIISSTHSIFSMTLIYCNQTNSQSLSFLPIFLLILAHHLSDILLMDLVCKILSILNTHPLFKVACQSNSISSRFYLPDKFTIISSFSQVIFLHEWQDSCSKMKSIYVL